MGMAPAPKGTTLPISTMPSSKAGKSGRGSGMGTWLAAGMKTMGRGANPVPAPTAAAMGVAEE